MSTSTLLLVATLWLPAAPGPWKLVLEDDFERSEVGPGWSARSGKASIQGGRLVLEGAGATILSTRGLAPDVRLEFEAEANPDLPPCDLSAALCGSELWGYHYLLAFGGNSNQVNQILGAGVRAVDPKPPFLIEHGKRYRISATKEGRRLCLEVDGRTVLEAEDPDPVGGPGFDRVGLVTWNGMLVDRVRVWERTSPAPGGPTILRAMPDVGYAWEARTLSAAGPVPPAVARGIELYNARRYREAAEAFRRASPPTLASVAGLAWVVGDLAHDETAEDQEILATLAAEVARATPEDPRARDLALAAEWFRRITVRSRDRVATTRLVMAGRDRNPFWHKARLFQARYHNAWAREAGDARRIREAADMFLELRATWPEVLALREFAGERVAWRPELTRPESAGPAWARWLEECFRRQHAVLDWWFTAGQSPDGQLGGGWGDDVEILRGWVPVASITTAGEPAIAGIERLAEGVWTHCLRDGYSTEIGDVEHSAEPSADALPGMILLRHGDPLWIERNLRSAKTIRERFLAVNDRGRLQFRSAEFGADGVNEHPRAGGDTGYHARAMRHFVALGWYGIPEAREAFLGWCDTWREAILEPVGTKPAGLVPASLFFPSGRIDSPDGRPWHDDGAHYYGFPGIPIKIHEAQLAAAFLSGDRRYLDAVATMLRLATSGPLPNPDPRLPGDDPRNLLADVVHHAHRDVLSVYRWLTGERVFDGYLLAWGSPGQRFQVDRDVERLEADLGRTVEGLRHGWTQLTSEVLQTDRAGLPGEEAVFMAYTGAVRSLTDAGAITLSVTWETPGLEFAALVTEATPARLRVRLHGFQEDEWTVGLRPWRLVPGRYELSIGAPVAPPAGGAPERIAWTEARDVRVVHRGAPIPIRLPPGRTLIVDLRLREAIPRPSELPDLALATRNVVRRDGSGVSVTVHNVGGAAAGPFEVALEARPRLAGTTTPWTRVAAAWAEGLPAIRNLSPSVRTVALALPAGGPLPDAGDLERFDLRVVLDPAGQVEELCEENNAAVPASR